MCAKTQRPEGIWDVLAIQRERLTGLQGRMVKRKENQSWGIYLFRIYWTNIYLVATVCQWLVGQIMSIPS